MKTSTKLSFAAAAMAGLLAGASSRTMAAPVSSHVSNIVSARSIGGLDAKLGVKTFADDTDKHDCAGKNSCKNKGGCKTGDNGCKGKNSCKGKGGCATNKDSKLAANSPMGVKAIQLADDTDKHDCAGKNSCKNKGGCKTGDNGCKGKNSCKGKGGCATNKDSKI